MRKIIEGVNGFSGYDTIQFYVDFPKKKYINSFQITFGGYMVGDLEEFSSQMRKYNREIRQIIYNRSKDGYYKDKFIYIDGFTEHLKKCGQGGIFNEAFFFTEETYDKYFMIDYLKTLFDEINEFHREHKFFKFIKYKDRAKIKEPKRP